MRAAASATVTRLDGRTPLLATGPLYGAPRATTTEQPALADAFWLQAAPLMKTPAKGVALPPRSPLTLGSMGGAADVRLRALSKRVMAGRGQNEFDGGGGSSGGRFVFVLTIVNKGQRPRRLLD